MSIRQIRAVAEVEHLNLIQGVITRLAGNSFLLKGWSVTLAAGLTAFARTDSNPTLAWIAVGVVMVLGALDASYLAQERAYRRLYDKARLATAVDWSLAADHVTARQFCSALLSWPVLPIHGVIAIGALCVAALA